MRFRETETVELKSIVMDDIKKEIIAFANCDGGTIYVCVADDGTVLGIENADKCALQISNMVRDAVKPDVTMFIHYETLECDGKAVVAAQTVPIIWQRKDCGLRVSMCGRDILLYRQQIRLFGR